MAREFGFNNATDFALVVESWTQEQRRNCLDTFYRSREVKLLERELAELKAALKAGAVEAKMGNGVDGMGAGRESTPRSAEGKRRSTMLFLSDDDEDEDDEL